PSYPLYPPDPANPVSPTRPWPPCPAMKPQPSNVGPFGHEVIRTAIDDSASENGMLVPPPFAPAADWNWMRVTVEDAWMPWNPTPEAAAAIVVESAGVGVHAAGSSEPVMSIGSWIDSPDSG